MRNSVLRRPRLLTAVALVGTGVLVLSGCEGGAASGSDEINAGGPSVPFGASDEEWAAAFEDADSIELVYQSANPATSAAGKRAEEEWKKVEEITDGKIQIELAFNDSIATNVEADEALIDGRLDLHLLVPFLQPTDFPVSGKVALETTMTRDSSLVAGSLASLGALNEVLFETPEFNDEYDALGLTVIDPIQPTGNTVIACSDPLKSLADLKGKQIRVGPEPAFGQIEAIGATPVSVAFADLYESLQRGIVDCMSIGLGTLGDDPDLAELVPYIMAPTGTGTGLVSNPGVELAGARWSELPLAAQQLIWDTFHRLDLRSTEDFVSSQSEDVVEVAEKAGGGLYTFDEEVSEALKGYNDEVIAGWADSDLVDGTALMDRIDDAYDKWDAIIADSGYSDAEISEVEGWLGADTDWSAFEEAYYENVTLPNRPSN